MESIEHFYKKIAESINEMIPCNWDKVWMYAEILDDSAGITFCFNEQVDGEYIYGHEIPLKYNVSKSTYIHLLYELSNNFEELKREYIKNKLGAWTTATLELESSGKFSIDYGYEDILNIGLYGIQRRAVWEYKTFGILPKNEKNKETVLNYIKNKEENN
ncbi:immunity protein YezG family protein [Bacillus safensis]|uniref:immunity protein YezG family protein n=1 Tax=Bacillus safensis TaxID=561879 RepID=UPI000DAD07CF|nr:immunity protein YezG family protein [Bacillus safensis]